ncbi:MAG: transcription-repair coupling factor [Ignavibacteria bacterium]|nr:transcription-repair coupling factor [Ignavibacteria bacterium]
MKGIQDNYSETLRYLISAKPVLDAARFLTENNSVSVKQLSGSARSVFIGALWSAGNRPFVVITPDDRSCTDVTFDLGILLGSDTVCSIHSASKRRSLTGSNTLQHDEIDALLKLNEGARTVVVVAAQALPVLLPGRHELADVQQTLNRGMELDFDSFSIHLALNGYERTDYVGRPGEMAVRGGIIDVYPGGWNNPLRIEFWGDTIDSIREFEPLSQRSIREHDTVTILTKVFHTGEQLGATIVEHFPADAILVYDSPDAIESELHRTNDIYDTSALRRWPRVDVNPLGHADIQTQSSTQPPFAGSIEQMLTSAASLVNRGINLHLGADGLPNIRRIRDLCEGIAEQTEEGNSELSSRMFRTMDAIRWHSSSFSDGFVWTDVKLACYAEHQIFGRQRAQQRSRKNESGITLRELQQIHRGDYVVHEDKGIGQFDGIRTIEINGSKVDCVKLLFAGSDVLYVHLNYVHKLSKYASEEGSVPRVSKLGSAEWERRKSRAKSKIKDIARDLIRLYAQRKSQPGYSYPGDTVWQKEFEASFQYEDTADQARTTAELKFDMEAPSPMDRLVCGDVGFGKTEIAIRAAFKAAQAGKQVAMLVPTTILAQQHFVTFRDRLHRYPINIEVLSRFRSKASQKEILEKLRDGKVDIIIGTHRLLSKDVEFRQLGLLIIDEEHRFGVTAKEKLRSLRSTVDTLTLTATPIPRTLNFSLMGARDLSIIETPPRNRLPITTEILEWDDDVVRDALLFESDREGQSFVVTDRINDMDKLRMRIQMLAPALRIGVAHGQMPTEELESVMESFLERKTDVLISTKIIESGLDIPNANTIIIVNSDNFGLAELYQLRGRVGRSNTQAYCYLVVPPIHTLSRTALRRLQALEEFTDLGSGFQLAMRDLEIRGSGNLLGGEQSGFIVEMGFELYQKIIDEAMEELRTEEFAEMFAGSRPRHKAFINEDVAIELDVDTLLPSSYIPGDTDRYEAYKRLYNAHSEQEVSAVFDELRDRFGALTQEADNMLFAVRLRIAALATGFVRVVLAGTTLKLECPPESDSRFYTDVFPLYLEFISTRPNTRLVQQGKRLLIESQLARREDAITLIQMFADKLVVESLA